MPQTPTDIARLLAHRAAFSGALLFVPALVATMQPATAAPRSSRTAASSARAQEKHVGVWGWTSGSQTYLRARPGAQTPPVAKVARHTKLFVWGTYNGWYRVETPDHVFGWVFNTYISAPEADKLPKLSHQKAKQASNRTAHQTMYGSPKMLRQFYARYGAPGAVKGLKKQGVRLSSGSSIRSVAGGRKKTTRIAKTAPFDAAARTRSPRSPGSQRLAFDDPTMPSSRNRALAPRLPATSWASRERAVRGSGAASERFAAAPQNLSEAPLTPEAAPSRTAPTLKATIAAVRPANTARRTIRPIAQAAKPPAKTVVAKAAPVKTLPKIVTRRTPVPRLAVAVKSRFATTAPANPVKAPVAIAPTRIVARPAAPRIAAPNHNVPVAPHAVLQPAPRVAAKPPTAAKPRTMMARRPAAKRRVVPAPRLAMVPPLAPMQPMRDASQAAPLTSVPITPGTMTPAVTSAPPAPQLNAQPAAPIAPEVETSRIAPRVTPSVVKPMVVAPVRKPAKAAAPPKKRVNWRVVRREQRRKARLAVVAQRRARLRLKMGAPAQMIPPLSSPALAPISPQELMRARDSYLSARKPVAPPAQPAPGLADAKSPAMLSPSSFQSSTPGTTTMPLFPVAPSAPFYVISARQTPTVKTPAKAPAKAISRGGSPRDYALYYQQRQAKPQTETSPFGQGLANQALTYRGTPYVYGSASPRRGFDCSGLLFYMLRQRGYNPPRTAAGYRNYGKPVAKADLKPGDIVLFANTYKRGISHIGVYTGKGKFVHAATSGTGVRVDALNSAYYAHKYYGARRVK